MDNIDRYYNCIIDIQSYIRDHYNEMGPAAKDLINIIANIGKDENK